MNNNKENRREKIIGFILANIENENFKLLTNAFGQRYLFLKETKKEDTKEFEDLKILFDSLHVSPIFDAEKGVVFKMEDEKKEFFNKRKIKKCENGEIKLINDIYFDIREELSKYFKY